MSELVSKYLRFHEWGIQVDIRRAGKQLTRRFFYRHHRSMEATEQAARAWRDRTHQEVFGCPVSSGFFHVTRRRGASRSTLPPGISIGYSPRKPTPSDPRTRKPLWYVVSYTIHPEDGSAPRCAKRRFNIEHLGDDRALQEACAFRSSVIT